MSNWYVVPSDKDLMHHGILGMKWGVRRYQNKDGSLTAAGRKRYGDHTNLPVAKTKKQLNEFVYRRKEELNNNLIHEMDMMSKKAEESRSRIENTDFLSADKIPFKYGDKSYYIYDDGTKKEIEVPKELKRRIDEATTLGMRALDNLGYLNFGEDGQDLVKEEWARDWFLYEDQTIGLPMLADLVNQGKTSGQIKKLQDDARIVQKYDMMKSKLNNDDSWKDTSYGEPYFDLIDSFNSDKYIEECIKIKKGT